MLSTNTEPTWLVTDVRGARMGIVRLPADREYPNYLAIVRAVAMGWEILVCLEESDWSQLLSALLYEVAPITG